MQNVALSWMAYHLTQSPFILGLISFSSQIPCLVFTPLAGVWSDKYNRQRMMIFVQSLAMLQAVILTVVTFLGVINIYYILPLAFFLGVVTSMETPIRHSFFTQLIDNPADRGNAIALNSTMVNSTRLIGPVIAGILIPLIGEAFCFLFNSISYLAVLFSLFSIKILKTQPVKEESGMFSDLKDGLKYSMKNKPIRDLLLLIVLMGFFGMSFLVLLPIYAKDIFNGDAHTLGLLMSSMGIGALTAALSLAYRKTVIGLGQNISIASFLMSFALILTAVFPNLILALILLSLFGYGMIILLAASNTIIQTIVDENRRGRVMSFYTLAFMGFGPIGSLAIGWVSGKWGALNATLSFGLLSLLISILFFLNLPKLKKVIYPIYKEKRVFDSFD